MEDFYIRPAYRRRGAGLGFARAVIARFPGPWTLTQYKAKTDSIAFWRTVSASGLSRKKTTSAPTAIRGVKQSFVA